MQRIFLIHGWGGNPKSDWFPWAEKELGKKGYKVIVPEMPDTGNPKIGPWVAKLAETVGEIRADDILIGHSIGCLTVIRFLETFKDNEKISKVILVAPWQFLTLDENENPEIAKPWQAENVDYEKVRVRADKFIAVFSEDDPWVPYEKNLEYFKEKLNPKIITKYQMGHYNMTEIPFLLELLK